MLQPMLAVNPRPCTLMNHAVEVDRKGQAGLSLQTAKSQRDCQRELVFGAKRPASRVTQTLPIDSTDSRLHNPAQLILQSVKMTGHLSYFCPLFPSLPSDPPPSSPPHTPNENGEKEKDKKPIFRPLTRQLTTPEKGRKQTSKQTNKQTNEQKQQPKALKSTHSKDMTFES